MSAVSVNIRMDSEVKDEAKMLFNELGMDMTTAVNMFVRQAIYERAIPFRIERSEVPNAETRKAISDAEKGIGMSKTFDSAKEMFEELEI